MELGWATPFLLLAVYGLVRYAAPFKHKDPKTGVSWNAQEAVGITVFIYFFSQLIGGLTLYIIPSIFGWSEARITDWLSKDAVGQFAAAVVIQSLSLGLLLAFLRRRKANLKTIGLYGKPKWHDVGYALAGYGLYFLCYIVVVVIVKQLIPSIDFEQKQEIGFDDVSRLHLPLVFISLVVLPPIIEEITVRGFLYSGLKQQLSKPTAALVASVVFAVAHLQAGSSAPLLWIAAIDTFILSLVLIKLRETTGRLWSPIMLHAFKNGIAFASIFIFHLA